MTAVLEPRISASMALAVETKYREMAFREALFDATRPACPSTWCDGTCTGIGHMGDATLHYSDHDSVTASTDFASNPKGNLEVRAVRHDNLNEASEGAVEVSDPNELFVTDDRVFLTVTEARRFAALLLTAADRAEPEQDVPAERVRVGDYIQVDGEWLYVYCVDHDEPSHTVKLFPTVDPATWPEVEGGDEDSTAKYFEPGTSVLVRRGGA